MRIYYRFGNLIIELCRYEDYVLRSEFIEKLREKYIIDNIYVVGIGNNYIKSEIICNFMNFGEGNVIEFFEDMKEDLDYKKCIEVGKRYKEYDILWE